METYEIILKNLVSQQELPLLIEVDEAEKTEYNY